MNNFDKQEYRDWSLRVQSQKALTRVNWKIKYLQGEDLPASLRHNQKDRSDLLLWLFLLLMEDIDEQNKDVACSSFFKKSQHCKGVNRDVLNFFRLAAAAETFGEDVVNRTPLFCAPDGDEPYPQPLLSTIAAEEMVMKKDFFDEAKSMVQIERDSFGNWCFAPDPDKSESPTTASLVIDQVDEQKAQSDMDYRDKVLKEFEAARDKEWRALQQKIGR